jgi:putative oxidoreductase
VPRGHSGPPVAIRGREPRRTRFVAASAVRRILAPGWSGRAAWAATAIRVTAGVLFVLFSAGKFVDHAHEAADFRRYGVPVPNVAVYAVGALELTAGVLLVLGLLTRPAALALAANLVGAIATAGRVEGGSFNLGVAPAMLVTMLVIVWAGPGSLALDERLFRASDALHARRRPDGTP